MKEIFKRVSKWNAERYEQVNDVQLSINLVTEELLEYSEDPIEQLDALCDMVYVAMGIIWKCGEDLEDLLPINSEEPLLSISPVLKLWQAQTIDSTVAAKLIIRLCYSQASNLGYTSDDFEAALLVVCDSNDTKEVKRVASNVKANISKGSTYVPPTAGLTAIYNAMISRVCECFWVR